MMNHKTLPLTLTVLTLIDTLGSCVQGSWGKLPDGKLKQSGWGGEPECTFLGSKGSLWVVSSWHIAVGSKRVVPSETGVTSQSLNSVPGNTSWSCQLPRLWLSPNWPGLQLPGQAQREDTALLKERKKKARNAQ